jgi:hypothetical protein
MGAFQRRAMRDLELRSAAIAAPVVCAANMVRIIYAPTRRADRTSRPAQALKVRPTGIVIRKPGKEGHQRHADELSGTTTKVNSSDYIYRASKHGVSKMTNYYNPCAVYPVIPSKDISDIELSILRCAFSHDEVKNENGEPSFYFYSEDGISDYADINSIDLFKEYKDIIEKNQKMNHTLLIISNKRF